MERTPAFNFRSVLGAESGAFFYHSWRRSLVPHGGSSPSTRRFPNIFGAENCTGLEPLGARKRALGAHRKQCEIQGVEPLSEPGIFAIGAYREHQLALGGPEISARNERVRPRGMQFGCGRLAQALE